MESTIFMALGWTLVHSLWQVTLVTIVVYLLLNAGWIKNSNGRFLITLGGVFGIMFITTLTFLFYYAKVPAGGTLGMHPVQSARDVAGDGLTSPMNVLSSLIGRQLPYFTLAWLIGFGFYLLKLFGGLAYLIYIRKTAIPLTDLSIESVFQKLIRHDRRKQRITLLLSEKILSPLTFGLYRNCIVLPLAHINQLSLRDTEIILAHELSHIVRYDFLINLLVSIIKTLFYFHPGTWWLIHTLEDEREKATDRLAGSLCSADYIEYAKTLLKAQQLHQKSSLELSGTPAGGALYVSFWTNKKQLLSRIENLFGQEQTRYEWLHRWTALALFIGIFSLLSFTQILLPGMAHLPQASPDGEVMGASVDSEVKPSIPLKDSLILTMIVELEEDDAAIQEPSTSKANPSAERDTRVEKNYDIFVSADSLEIRRIIIHKDQGYPQKNKRKNKETYHQYTEILKPSDDPILLSSQQEILWKQLDSIEKRILTDVKDDLSHATSVHRIPRFENRDSLILLLNGNLNADSIQWLRHYEYQHQKAFSGLPKMPKIANFPQDDSLIYRYKLDKSFIENLRRNGLNHIGEFRHEHMPVDEGRMKNIVLMEEEGNKFAFLVQ